MKTIQVQFVGYGNSPLYAYNTPDDINVGDVLDSPRYSNFMQVVEVLDTFYQYVGASGVLTNDADKAKTRIKTLRINRYPKDILVTKIAPNKR